MDYELDDKLTPEKKEQLIRRVTDIVNQDILCIRDWFAIYDILLEACRRDEARHVENLLGERIGRE